MKQSGNRGVAAAIALALILSICAGSANGARVAMPDIGPSVKFDKSASGLKLAKLQGKAVLIIFFQSWCGICNGWSPDLIKQVQAAYGDDPRLVLIAIKTDGGGLAGAKKYMTSRGADPNKWIIASDRNARYYKQATGQNGLWRFALIAANGTIAEAGSAGMFMKQAGPKKFWLAHKDLLKQCGDVKGFLPKDAKYPKRLAPIARLVETGCFARAIKLCSAVRGAKSRKAAIALQKEIVSIVKAKMTAATDIMTDEEKSSADRYGAYQTLSAILVNFRRTAAGRDAHPFVVKMGRTPAIRKEKAAERSCSRAMLKLGEAGKKDWPRALKGLQAVAKKHEGTRYGGLAKVVAASFVKK